MPTPVITARQCLTPEAAHALDEAVSVARRRGHSQTTSLHAVSALLSIPSSILRDACVRARNSAYTPRLQFKALELCLSVSLDRVPASQLSEQDPPVSNSLMAAIKRSQANQRRQPENFHLYQQQQCSTTSVSCIKVELQNLILSILDDPVVSRVFGESGFRSSEIKLAIVRPLPQVLRLSQRFRGPPMFLCNLSDHSDPGPGRRGFSFPFFSGFTDGDENCRRIGEVLVRNKGRNPLLVGVCAYDTLASFNQLVEKRKDYVLPVELSGLRVICIESDVMKFASENFDKGCVDLRFEEVGRFVEQNLGPGLVVNLGDLKAFISSENDYSNSSNGLNDLMSYIVEKLTRMLQLYGRKVWLIGTTASYEGYLKFVSRFPSVEKDWDLQLLPITSFRTSMPESCPRSSLMESFIPFGGFFSTPSELNGSLSSSYQCISRCHLCNEKCEQEVLAVSKGGCVASVADQYQSNLPSWLQMAELGTNKGLDVKTRDDGDVLSAKVAGLQKKWDSICWRLHLTRPQGSNTLPSGFPTVVGFQLVEDKKDDAEKGSSNNTNAPLDGNRCMNVPIDLQKISRRQLGVPLSAASVANTESVKQWERPSKEEDHESDGLRSPCSYSNSSIADGNRASPTSATSVTTDLGLRISPISTSYDTKKPENKHYVELSRDLSGSFSPNNDVINGSISDHLAHSSSFSSLDIGRQFDPTSFKMLVRALTEKVSCQDEAVHLISQTIAHYRTRNERHQGSSLKRDIWFNFLGPDRCSKRKIAAALAEIIFGSSENLISADLSPQDGIVNMHSEEVHAYDVMFRGKTIIDYVAGELGKKPLAVVFLENVDKADVQAQNSLSRAIRTGKFSDSHGREVGINNAIFVTTSTLGDDKKLSSTKDFSTYSEERILRIKGQPMQMLIEQAPAEKMVQNLNHSPVMRKVPSSSVFVNKRKLVGANQNVNRHKTSEVAKRAHKTSSRYLDLNLPAEENDMQIIENGDSDNDSMSSNSKAWLQDFLDQLDRIVVFKPFDFDALGERILTGINDSFHKIVGSECLLDIDSKVTEQLLAAAYLSPRKRVVEEWMEQVLNKGFVEVLERYNLSAHSIVKLVSCKGLFLDEDMAGGHLPSKIILN
ncbi:protein SMAX1-LIKE 7 isoform X2 [Ricinus communis]|uniref:Clp R domain-containing protein n=1 Tax=Ricinus communis TaxID=3988 RepID=B9T561_RICCO|nr:protein SMAX1-LIKE 7 isoform X2 [Ricinus communis]EEF28998.1 conserved hypothetical protein [Ricinus communis]|eukprot:XP_002533380.1 protein SMAX1-LIKE 7 [Ricinus communis]